MPMGGLPAGTGKTMRFTGITILKVENDLLDRLSVFRLSHQVTALDLILRKLADGPPAFLHPAQPVSR